MDASATEIREMMRKIGDNAKATARQLATATTAAKNAALRKSAESLRRRQNEILSENAKDMAAVQEKAIESALLDRLMLNKERIEAMAKGLDDIAELPDPVGVVTDEWERPNGLRIQRRRVPLGVIGVIYESRPNVTVDITALCLKSGNACILRGGKESINSNTALARLIHRAIVRAGIAQETVQYIENPDRTLVNTLLQMKEYVSLLIPRGGSGLIKFVAEHATMPVVTGGIGVCHTYIDQTADLKMASDIVFNAKVQRPTVCNALDTVLIHSGVALSCLPLIANRLGEAEVELHCDQRALNILGPEPGMNILPALEEDWGKEFLSLTAAIKLVDSLDDALAHIETYGSGHSDGFKIRS